MNVCDINVHWVICTNTEFKWVTKLFVKGTWELVTSGSPMTKESHLHYAEDTDCSHLFLFIGSQHLRISFSRLLEGATQASKMKWMLYVSWDTFIVSRPSSQSHCFAFLKVKAQLCVEGWLVNAVVFWVLLNVYFKSSKCIFKKTVFADNVIKRDTLPWLTHSYTF